jgi:hypothetical protein
MDRDNTVINETAPTVEPTSSSPATTTNHEQQVIQQESPVKKKKKCHGQRKKQRYRRQLYAHGLNSATVNRLVDERFSTVPSMEEPDTLNFNVCIPLDRVGSFRIHFCLSIVIGLFRWYYQNQVVDRVLIVWQ